MEQRSRDDLELIASIAMDLPVGVWVAKVPGGEFVFANKTFQEILGIGGRDDVAAGGYAQPYGIHDTTGALYPENRMPFVRAVHEKRTVVIDDIVIHRPDGGRRNIRARAKPIFKDDGEMGWVAITFTDITREIEAERAKHETEARLLHAQKMESVGNLAGGIAHDFNNLLASMKMIVTLLDLQESDPAKKESLAKLSQVTDSAVQLTRGLLGFARRGKNLAQKLAVDDVVTSVVDLLRRTVDPRIDVDAKLDAGDIAILGDASQLEQVLMNLGVNARDAIAAGGKITFRTAVVELDEPAAAARPPLKPGRHVLVEVSDTGTGIDPAIRPKIFEPYFTTKNSGPVKGTGLGLATVYGIVAAHKGSIEVLDAVPHGAVMQVLLPAADGVARREAPRARPTELHTGTGLVLVADDEPLVRESTARALRLMGYDVLEARDGEEAVDLFRARHADLAAVVLDMMMPRLSGREAWLKMHEVDRRVPVLLVTGYALNEEAQRILDLGVQGFLAKPFDVHALSDAMRRLGPAGNTASSAA